MEVDTRAQEKSLRVCRLFLSVILFIRIGKLNPLSPSVGEGVSQWKIGDRVAIEAGVPCGDCQFCRLVHFPLPHTVDFLTTSFFATFQRGSIQRLPGCCLLLHSSLPRYPHSIVRLPVFLFLSLSLLTRVI